jgi:hypothetical protein
VKGVFVMEKKNAKKDPLVSKERRDTKGNGRVNE